MQLNSLKASVNLIITVYYDFQSVLQALKSNTLNSPTVAEMQLLLHHTLVRYILANLCVAGSLNADNSGANNIDRQVSARAIVATQNSMAVVRNEWQKH